MDFENASHGVSFTGMQTYQQELQMNTFRRIRDAINNTSEVENAVRAGWVGTAADNFIHNIQTGAQRMSDQVTEIENMLITELNGIMSQIGDMDENLVERE
jgi:uncharacterized protein YukE